MALSGNIPLSQPRDLSELGLDITLNTGNIFPKLPGDRIKPQVKVISYKFRNVSVIMLTRGVLVVHTVSIEGHANGGVSQCTPVNTKSLTES